MRTLLTTDEEVTAAQKLLADFKERGALPADADDAAMWNAQRVVSSVIHEPTGEKMFLPGRMSMFVPVNVPIAAGLLMSKSVAAGAFWQWVNQTYNVVNNYVNRAGPNVEYGPLAQSYALAVSSALSVVVGVGKLLQAFPALTTFGPFVPYLATITAGTCNVGFARMDEMKNGIEVCDKDGNKIGLSVAAGKIAVFKTVTTRSMFLPIFPLVIPPVVMKAVLATGVIAAGTPLAVVVELGTIAACMSVGLPAALALQPLQMELEVSSLEPAFQGLKSSDGSALTHVYASKGM